MWKYIDLITPEQLAGSPGRFCILDAQPVEAYQDGHIPGAQPVNWSEWCDPAPEHASPELKQPGYWGVLQDFAKYNVANRLSALGLENERPVVVYADGPVSKGREGRVAWMLLYWGARHVSLLNGGWSAWRAAGYPVERQHMEVEKGAFSINLCPARRISLEELKAMYALNRPPCLIDTRSTEEFIGERYAYQPRMGHIPGAHHWPYASLFDRRGRFIEREIYLEMLCELAVGNENRVACCEVGVRSCLLALLHEIYTGQVIRNFDGSMMAWGLDQTLDLVRI